MMSMDKQTIWFDFDNSPHVRYFLPVVLALEDLGYAGLFTARNVAETVGLLRMANLPFIPIGSAFGRSKIKKVLGTVLRAIILWQIVHGRRPILSVSSSRSCALASRMLNIPSLIMVDYEGVELQSYAKLGCRLLVPLAVSISTLASKGISSSNVSFFPGLKEDITFSGESAESLDRRERLPLDHSKVLICVRPPSIYSHYQTEHSTSLYMHVMKRLASESSVHTIILPRTNDELLQHVMKLPWQNKPFVPTQPLDGTAVVWQCDAVLTGGGTMAREAAVLGVPAYSVFAGAMGDVDAMLVRQGKLKLLRNEADIQMLQLTKRRKSEPTVNPESLETVVSIIHSMAKAKLNDKQSDTCQEESHDEMSNV